MTRTTQTTIRNLIKAGAAKEFADTTSVNPGELRQTTCSAPTMLPTHKRRQNADKLPAVCSCGFGGCQKKVGHILKFKAHISKYVP